MKIYAGVYVYKRPRVLEACAASILDNIVQPDMLHFIDDASGPEVRRYLDGLLPFSNVIVTSKAVNGGATHSGRMMLADLYEFMPQYAFFIEADYIFHQNSFRHVIDVFEKTEAGKYALGIAGYDHPSFYNAFCREKVYPDCMIAQVGEDNVNRSALFRPFEALHGLRVELVSNTCPTCYLNWRRLLEIGAEFPTEMGLFYEAFAPKQNPNYPPSGEYGAKNIVDDGMLSHAISLMWNKWAVKHGINREKYGAWLNIKPSVANNITGGGVHSGLSEMETDGGSPTWKK